MMRVIAAAAACAAIAGASAQADGVVISSSSSAYAVGDRVEVGRQLTVEDGAEVTVLDRSGVVRRISGPGGRYEEPASAAGPTRGGGRSMAAAARLALSFSSLGRRSGLGSTRGGDEDCEVDPGSRSIVPPECVAAAEAAAEPAALTVRSRFDGVLTCDYAEADDIWRRLPLTADGSPLPIEGRRRTELSGDSQAGWPAASPDLAVRCQAVDASAWAALAPYWSPSYAPDEARAVMATFAAISGGSFTEGVVEE